MSQTNKYKEYFDKTIALIKSSENIFGRNHSELATIFCKEKDVVRIVWYRGSLVSSGAIELPPPDDDSLKGETFAKDIRDFFFKERAPWTLPYPNNEETKRGKK